MPYVAPTTANAVAGSAILASDMLTVMNDIIDHESRLVAIDGSAAWVDYVPQLRQGTTNITSTVLHAKYLTVGKSVFVNAKVQATGTGTSGGIANMSLPVNPVFSFGPDTVIGTFIYNDTGSAYYSGPAVYYNTGYVASIAHAQANYIGATPTFTTASGDVISVVLQYVKA